MNRTIWVQWPVLNSMDSLSNNVHPTFIDRLFNLKYENLKVRWKATLNFQYKQKYRLEQEESIALNFFWPRKFVEVFELTAL